MNNKLGEFLRQFRENHNNMSLRTFGRLSDISHTHIDSIERGVDPRTGKPVKISNETIEKIAKATQKTPEYIFNLSINAKPQKKKTVKIPVLGSVKAGLPGEAIQDIIDYEEISEELAMQGEFFALRIKGESMEPRMLDGDTVIIRMQPDIESGEIAVILIANDNSTVKKVIKQNNGILLTAFNPAVYTPTFYSNEEIEALPVKILGRVVEFRGKV